VWYWGNAGRNSLDSGAGGLFFQSDMADSGASWKVRRHPAYGATDAPYPAYLYAGHNIGFDARLDMPDWELPDCGDGDWENASEKDGARWGKLFARPIPMLKDSGLKAYTSFADGAAVLPYAAHITPYFKIKAKAGRKIDIRTDRYQVRGGPGDETHVYNGHRTEYITKDGAQAFESPDWVLGEKVLYAFPEDVEVLEVKYRETGYDTDFAGSFSCGDPFLNTLYEKCRRTLYVCMRDNYMDCPDRERGQWIGDVSVQVPQTFYALGRGADALTKKAIYDFINWRDGDVLRGNVPGEHATELPAQSLNAVSEIGMIAEYALHSGDTSVFDDCYDAVKRYLALWQVGGDGLVSARKGDWRWFDHGANVDEAVLENAWYFSALKMARRLAKNKEDIAEYESRIRRIKENFDKNFWDGGGYRSGAFYDDRANALAALAGFVKDKGKIAKLLREVKNSTPYMEAYVLEALASMGYVSEVLQRLRERYKGLVENENTTLWEDFSVLGSKNHAWSSGALTFLAKHIAGIAPETPGYGVFRVFPNLCGMHALRATVPSVKGEIKLDVQTDGKTFKLTLVSPPDTTALVGIPKAFAREASNYYGENDAFIIFKAEAGVFTYG
jgi:hypothetical protein